MHSICGHPGCAPFVTGYYICPLPAGHEAGGQPHVFMPIDEFDELPGYPLILMGEQR